MVLFLQDWLRYPSAIVDTQTKNESFLHMAALYAEMGIKNNAFHLSLMQPHLQGVDPFDENLSEEQMVSIALECRINPWYALREIIQLPPQGSLVPIHYKANRSNLALTWCFFNHIDFANIQPRQTGKSGSTDSLWAVVLKLMGVNTDIQLLTKDNKLRRANVERLKSIMDFLPPYLNPVTAKDVDNFEAVTCLARGNHYKTAVGLASKEAADALGRGLTTPIFHGDELPYIPNVHISFPVALSSGTAARENVKAVNGMYCNIFTTTAGKRDTIEGKFAYNLVHDGLYWNENLLDTKDNDILIKHILTNSVSKTPMINGTFSHRQLGKSDQWLRDAIANSRSDEELANRDYFNIWSTGTDTSPIDEHLLIVVRDSEMDPLYSEVTKDKYIFKWYTPRDAIMTRMERGQYVLGLDSSNAVGKDNNGLSLMDTSDMGTLASASINEANLYKFAVWISNMMIMFDKLILVIENKSSAQGIIDVLLVTLPHNGIDPFKRIYNRLLENIEQYPAEEKLLEIPLSRRKEHFYLKNKAKFGFNTNGNSREFLYGTVLQQAIKSTGHLVKDRTLSSELNGLITKNGRVDHIAGGHDDNCIAWLLCHYFIFHSKNLHLYDIDISIISSNVSNSGAVDTDKDRVKRGEQKQLRLKIDILKDELLSVSTPGNRIRVEHLLKQQIAKSEIDGGEPVSLDDILNRAKETSVKRRSLKEAVNRLLTN